MRGPWAAIAVAWVAWAGTAQAQYNVPSQATGEKMEMVDPTWSQPMARSDEAGWEVGASMDFLTRDAAPDTRALKFTDLVQFRLHALRQFGKRTEVFGGLDLLPKQPSSSDEPIWQSALLGARLGLGPTFSSYLRGQAGPGLGRDGYWSMLEAAGQAKVELTENVLYWESTLGGTYTQLYPEAATSKSLWQTELLAQTGIAIRDKRGFFATWLTFSFHFPLVARPLPSDPDPRTRRALDPQPRVDASIGMLVGVNRGLDLFVEASILDRGDLEDPRTTLPILNGGFDQRRLLFGFNRRFGQRRR